jgi:D-galacturonate reductase
MVSRFFVDLFRILFYFHKKTKKGYFSGQQGYGYRSFEAFIDAVAELNAEKIDMNTCDAKLATIGTTLQETAVLEAGRISLDNQCAMVELVYENDTSLIPIELKLLK